MNGTRRIGVFVALAILATATEGCQRCDKPHLPVYEPEPKVIEVDAPADTPAPGDIGSDSPAVKGTITLGQGGGVLLDFELNNAEPEYTFDKVFVYAGNYNQADASDVPEYPSTPSGSTWVATETLQRNPGPNVQRISVFMPPGKLDPLQQQAWAFLSLYLIYDDGSGQLQRRRQFYRFWREATDDKTPVPPKYFAITPGLYNPVDPTGPLHAW